MQPIDGVYRLVGDVGELDVPDSLHALLAARLDSLQPQTRRLVADAAVLGTTFPEEALVAVSGLDADAVADGLAELLRREVLTVTADPLSPERGSYRFAQELLRQVAYDTLSRRDRKARHLAVAAHLRATFPNDGEEVADVVARHYLDALAAVPDDADADELRDLAVEALVRAAERAARTGAPDRASRSYAEAADLVEEAGGTRGARARCSSAPSQRRSTRVRRARSSTWPRRTSSGTSHWARPRRRPQADPARPRPDAAGPLHRSAARDVRRGDRRPAGPAGRRHGRGAGAAGHGRDVRGDAGGGRRHRGGAAPGPGLGARTRTAMAGVCTCAACTWPGRAARTEAVFHIREAVRLAEEADRPDLVGSTYQPRQRADGLRPGYVGGNDPAGMDLSRRGGNRRGASVCVTNLAQVLIDTGRWDEAAELLAPGGDADVASDAGELAAWSRLVLVALRGDAVTARSILAGFEMLPDSDDPEPAALALGEAMTASAEHARTRHWRTSSERCRSSTPWVWVTRRCGGAGRCDTNRPRSR